MDKDINLITVPYDSSHFNERMGSGPLHIINRGLIQKLQGAGYTVNYTEIILKDDFPTEIASTLKLFHQIRSNVATSIQNQAFPLVLSGNCSASAGVVVGLDEHNLGVVWFDAHGDYETPETTLSGFLDGMALSMLTGFCWHNLFSSLKGTPVSGKHIMLIGARDLSSYEKESMSTNKINHISVDQIRHLKQEAIVNQCNEFIRNGIKKLHIHIDVDVIDPSIAPSNSYAVSNGLSKENLIQTINYCANQIPVASVTVASYDPSFDKDDKMLSLINELIEVIVDKV